MITRSLSRRRFRSEAVALEMGVRHKGDLPAPRRGQVPGSEDGPRVRGSHSGASGGGDVSSNYWSSSSYANNPQNAWIVNFNDGNVNNDNKTNGNYVRAVRAGS